MPDLMDDPTAFQRRVLDTVMKGLNQNMNLTELSVRMRSNQLAVHSAVRSLERKGLALTFRSDSSQWAVLRVAPTNKWRARLAAEAAHAEGQQPARDGQGPSP